MRLAVARGHEVVNLDALTRAARLDNVAGIADSPRYRVELADIREAAAPARLFAVRAPDAMRHLAAESHVDRSIGRPGTCILFEADRANWQQQGKPAGAPRCPCVRGFA